MLILCPTKAIDILCCAIDSSDVRHSSSFVIVCFQAHLPCNESMPLTPGSFNPQSPHFGALPFFLMWRYRSLPPGVLMTRTLFDLVLYLHPKCQLYASSEYFVLKGHRIHR